jgi:hypothetical protein
MSILLLLSTTGVLVASTALGRLRRSREQARAGRAALQGA